MIDGKTVGYNKAVKQVAYAQILNTGHYAIHDQGQYVNSIITDWVASLKDSDPNLVEE